MHVLVKNWTYFKRMRWTASSLQVLFYLYMFICAFNGVSIPKETSSYLIKNMSAFKESRLVELCLLFYYTHFRSIVLNVLKDKVKILQS